jgi:hypothetical protein
LVGRYICRYRLNSQGGKYEIRRANDGISIYGTWRQRILPAARERIKLGRNKLG